MVTQFGVINRNKVVKLSTNISNNCKCYFNSCFDFYSQLLIFLAFLLMLLNHNSLVELRTYNFFTTFSFDEIKKAYADIKLLKTQFNENLHIS